MDYRRNFLFFAGGLSLGGLLCLYHHWSSTKVRSRIFTVECMIEKPNFWQYRYNRQRYELYNATYSTNSEDLETFIEECKSGLIYENYDGLPVLYHGVSGYPLLEYKPPNSFTWKTVKTEGSL